MKPLQRAILLNAFLAAMGGAAIGIRAAEAPFEGPRFERALVIPEPALAPPQGSQDDAGGLPLPVETLLEPEVIQPGPATPEGMLLRFADRIAYLSHDFEDAVRAGILGPGDLPEETRRLFGEPGSAWIKTMIRAVIDESHRQGKVAMEAEVLEAMHRLRDFMFERVYLRPEAQVQNEKVVRMLRNLMDFYLENPDEMPESYRRRDEPLVTQVIDVVAGMSDRYALRAHDRFFRPR